MFKNLKFVHKMMLVPLLATTGFLLILLVTWLLGSRNEKASDTNGNGLRASAGVQPGTWKKRSPPFSAGCRTPWRRPIWKFWRKRTPCGMSSSSD